MKRTSYTADPGGSWDVWIGPGPCPKTGRMFHSVRWSNPYYAEAIRLKRADLAAVADRTWIAELVNSPKLNELELLRANLVGLRLGTSRVAHGLTLARLADGFPVREILAELDELAAENLELWQ